MKQIGKRIVSLAIMLCVSLGATVAYTQAYAVDYRENTSDSPVVMTVNGSEVKADEFASYMLYMMKYYEQMYAAYGMTGMWDDPDAAAMMGPAMPEMARSQAVFVRVVQEKFNEAGLTLSARDKKKLSDDRRVAIKNAGGKQEYLDRIAQFGFSDQFYDNYMVSSACFSKLNEYYFGENGVALPSDEELMQYFKDNYLAAKHILIQTMDAQGNQIRTEEEAKAEAQAVLDRLNGGEDFDTVMNEKSEDSGLAGNPDGYIFTEGDMMPAFYEAAKALGEGETSGLVQTDYGYHIIKRIPVDYDGELENYRSAIVMGMGKNIDELLNQWVSEADVQTTDEYDKVTYQTVYDYAPIKKPVEPTGAEDAPAETPAEGDAAAAE